MKKTINIYDFERSFKDMERNNHFSYDGLKALFEYLEDYEDSCDNEIELDVIALCCEFTEYKNLKEYNTEYPYCESLTQVQELTIVIPIGINSFIIQNY